MSSEIQPGKEYTGACHCGTVKFKCTLAPNDPIKCDCSFCDMRNAVMVSAYVNTFEILEDKSLQEYQFHTKVAKHYFCNICGIYTFHKRRFNPDLYGVNLRCLGISPNLPKVSVINGRQHAADGHPRLMSGVLTFTPSTGVPGPNA